ncbi:MAG: hypothetical protein AAB734_02835 [Patescibacteria group bacterium]
MLWLPTITLAAPRTFSELADLITNLINGGIGVALILGIVIYFYGIATNIRKVGEGEMSELRTHLFWGIIALFVMFSVWGILALLRNTLFGGGGYELGGSGQQVLCENIEDCVVE